jgi:hypothetical protein
MNIGEDPEYYEFVPLDEPVEEPAPAEVDPELVPV